MYTFFLRGGIFFVFSALFYTFAVGGWASFIRILVYGTIDLIFFFFFYWIWLAVIHEHRERSRGDL